MYKFSSSSFYNDNIASLQYDVVYSARVNGSLFRNVVAGIHDGKATGQGYFEEYNRYFKIYILEISIGVPPFGLKNRPNGEARYRYRGITMKTFKSRSFKSVRSRVFYLGFLFLPLLQFCIFYVGSTSTPLFSRSEK